MMELFVRPARVQLGAEELVELGRASGSGIPGRTPFLAARHELGRRIGNLTSDVQGYVTGTLAFELGTLASLLGVSYDSLLHGENVTFSGLEILLDSAPVLGRLLSQILLLGNTAIRYGLQMPTPLANGLGGILGNVGRALAGKNSSADNQKSVGQASTWIVSQAPASLQNGVKAMLDSTLVPV